MDRETASQPDVYSFNIFKPVEDHATARTIFRNALNLYVGANIVSLALETWIQSGDASDDGLIGALLWIVIETAFILWVRKRGSRWGGAIVLVAGMFGAIGQLLTSGWPDQSYGAIRGILFVDFGILALMAWLARALRFAFRHGESLRTEEASSPAVGQPSPTPASSEDL